MKSKRISMVVNLLVWGFVANLVCSNAVSAAAPKAKPAAPAPASKVKPAAPALASKAKPAAPAPVPKPAVKPVSSAATSAVSTVKDKAKTAVSSAATSAVSKAKDSVKSVATSAVSTVKDKAKAAVSSAATSAVSKAKDSVKSAATSAVSTVKDKAKAAISSTSGSSDEQSAPKKSFLGSLASKAKDSVKSAASSAVSQVKGSAGSSGEDQAAPKKSFLGSLASAAVSKAKDSVKSAASSAISQVKEKAQEAVSSAVSQVKEKAQGAVSSAVSQVKEKAQGAVSSVVEKAKGTMGNASTSVASEGTEVVDTEKDGVVTAPVLAGAGDQMTKDLYMQLKNFNLESQQLNLTIPVKSSDENGTEGVKNVGYVYDFGYVGIGNVNEGFAAIQGNLQPDGDHENMIPDNMRSIFQTIKNINPTMHFVFKFIALCNEFKLTSSGGEKVVLDENQKNQFVAKLTLLLARLSKSSSLGAQKIKPSEIINKLPKFLGTVITSIKMPAMVTEYDIAWARDCGGKPASDMLNAIANMRYAADYTDRTLMGEENIVKLLEAGSVGKLTATDFNNLSYALKHHLYDLDKGPELQAMDAEQRKEEINNRASELVILYSAVISRIPDKYQAIANDLYGLLTMFSKEDKDENGAFWTPLKEITIKIEKPLMGGAAENKQATLPTSRMLDIMFAKTSMFVNQAFEVEGVYPDGKYLWNDSSLSKNSARDSLMAIVLRAIKEHENESFNTTGGGVKGFVQYEFVKLHDRSTIALDLTPSLLESISGLLEPIIGDVQALITKAKTVAEADHSEKEAAPVE